MYYLRSCCACSSWMLKRYSSTICFIIAVVA